MAHYDEMTIRGKSWIKRFAHNKRFELGAQLCAGSNSVLDYGTGSGHFLKVLAEKIPEATLTGFEPLPEMCIAAQEEAKPFKTITIVNDLHGLAEFDCVTCFEVFEHLTEEEQIKTLRACKQKCGAGGKLIISVPIETGIAGLMKNLVRWMINQRHATKFTDVIKSFLGMRVERTVERGYIYSHLGFRFKDFEKVLEKENFKVTRRLTSPFGFLGPFANSQMFYVVG